MNTQYNLHQLKVKILKSEMNETLKRELSNLVFEIQQSLVKESDSLPIISLRQLYEKIDALQAEYDKGYTNPPLDDYKRWNRLGSRISALRIAKAELFPNAS